MPKMSEITNTGSFTKDMMGGFRLGNQAELIRRK